MASISLGKVRHMVRSVFGEDAEIIKEDEFSYPNRSSSDNGLIIVGSYGKRESANYNIYNRNDWLEIKNAFEAGQKLKPRLFSEGYRKP